MNQIKQKHLFALLLVTIVLLAIPSLLAAASAAASDPQLVWWTVDGGGDTSQGSGYTLSGTAGQPEASTISGGGYTLTGGVWGGGAMGDGLHRVYLPTILRDFP